jgi:hypothetical protein
MTSKLFVWKNPDPHTISCVTYAEVSPGHQWQEMEESDYEAWESAQRQGTYGPPPPPNSEQAPDIFGFFAEIATNPAMSVPLGDVLSRLMAIKTDENPIHDPIAALALSSGLQNFASNGDPTVFLVGWGLAIRTGLVPSELILGMQTLAAAYLLPSEFIEALQPENPS